jgi:putative component of toxin-antitoxin plasmid stabilization module
MAKFLFPSGWNLSLDFKGKAKIVKRLERVSDGNLGDSRSLNKQNSQLQILLKLT